MKIFDWHKTTASGFLLLFALLFDVAGASSFRLSNRKTRRQELCHPSFPPVIVSASISTVVAEWRFPVAPRTPHRGAWNEAAGRFATKTPAFTTQDANPKRRIHFCLFTFVHLPPIDYVHAITAVGPNNPLPNLAISPRSSKKAFPPLTIQNSAKGAWCCLFSSLSRINGDEPHPSSPLSPQLLHGQSLGCLTSPRTLSTVNSSYYS